MGNSGPTASIFPIFFYYQIAKTQLPKNFLIYEILYRQL